MKIEEDVIYRFYVNDGLFGIYFEKGQTWERLTIEDYTSKDSVTVEGIHLEQIKEIFIMAEHV